MSAFPDGGFHAFHAGGEPSVSTFFKNHPGGAIGGAVVSHEDEDGVVGDVEFAEFLSEFAEVVIEVGDHAVEFGTAFPGDFFFIGSGPFFRNLVGGLGGVKGEVEEEGFFFVLGDEVLGLGKPDVGGVALEFLVGAVALVGIIELIVAPIIGSLANSSGLVPDDVLEALIHGSAGSVVTEVPLADHASGVACFSKIFSHREFGGFEGAASAGGAESSGAGGVAPGHEGGTGGRAEGANVEVGEADGFCVEFIQGGGFEHGVTETGEIAVALVIGDDDDDVRRLRRRRMVNGE